MKPTIHAENNVKKYGGKIEDYLPIHQFMDSSKGAMCDVRHRALTHTSWFIQPDGILEKVFGVTFINSDGKTIAVRDIGEDHILEDFDGFIPTPQDFLKDIPVKPWMHRGGGTPNDPVTLPPSTVVIKAPETSLDRDFRIESVDPIDYWPPIPRESPPFLPNRWPGPIDGGIQVRDLVEINRGVEHIPFCCKIDQPIQNVGLGVEATAKLRDTFAATVQQNLNIGYSNSMGAPNQQIDPSNVIYVDGDDAVKIHYPEKPITLYDPETKEAKVQIWENQDGICMLDLTGLNNLGLNVSC